MLLAEIPASEHTLGKRGFVPKQQLVRYYAKQGDRHGSQNPKLKKNLKILFHGIFMPVWRFLEAVYANLSLVFDPKSQMFPKLVG